MPTLTNSFTDRVPSQFETIQVVKVIGEVLPIRPIIKTGVIPVDVANNKATVGFSGKQVIEVLPVRPNLKTGVLYPSNTDHR